ncbi:Argonaute complex, subunit Arb1 [Aspergillus unguis]
MATKTAIAAGEEEVVVPELAPANKQKKSRKPKSKRGKNKPTGFEEYYVDTPITAEEYEFELDLYDTSRPIVHRVEEALLRFNKNRRIEPDRLEVFQKYLKYGGIDVSPKMFAGTEDRDLKNLDNDEILLARGQTAINKEYSRLEIDFDAVVKGFLTSFFPFYFNPTDLNMIQLATVTIRSFLSYLLYHDVCPEYKENIHAARNSCDIATTQLWKNQLLTANGPGYFNTACSILFGGLEHEIYTENRGWVNPKDEMVRMDKRMAQKVIRFGLGVAGTDELATSFHEMFNSNTLKATKLEDIDGFEVEEVRFLDEDQRKFYHDQAPDLHPVGILLGKTYSDPGEPGYDLSPEEREEWNINGRIQQDLIFFVEESLLEHCYPGMKIIAHVWDLGCGFQYLEEIIKVYCSIYTPLANELMIGWKKPRDLTVKDEDHSDAEDSE